jgi:hypothetical protein
VHDVPGLHSVSNTQANAGVEARQRIVITIRLRMVVPLLEPCQITRLNVRIWTDQGLWIRPPGIVSTDQVARISFAHSDGAPTEADEKALMPTRHQGSYGEWGRH